MGFSSVQSLCISPHVDFGVVELDSRSYNKILWSTGHVI